MAINYTIYSNGNASSKTVSVDLASDFLASSSNGVSRTNRYFLKFITSARDASNGAFGVKVAEGLNDLVLNGEKQRISGSNVPYSDIKSMVVDYMYDFVHGHEDGQWGTTVTEQKPMKFN